MKNEVRLRKIGGAGMYDLVNKTNDITESIVLKISNGQPYYYAKLEAERLAVVLNCDLWEDDKLVRGTIYKIEEENINEYQGN